MLKPLSIAGALAVLAACSAPAGPKVTAHDGWARESGTSGMTAAYLTIENKGGADSLTGVRTTIGEATLHETSMEDGVMRMRAIDPGQGLMVPSNGKLALSPGGAHVMIMGVTRPLKAGDRFNLTLTFEKSRPEQVEVLVRPATHGGPAH